MPTRSLLVAVTADRTTYDVTV